MSATQHAEAKRPEGTELIELPAAETALDIYKKPMGLQPWLEKIREQVTGIHADVSTRKGREEIASRAFKVRKSKTALDGLGKQLVDDLKEVPKLVDAERKRMRDYLDGLADEVRAPLTAWEQAEEKRIAGHKAGIEWFRLRAEENRDLDSEELRITIAEVEAKTVDDSWEEFESEARHMRGRALKSLAKALDERERYEAEQEELQRLRAEAAERARRDEEERIAREAAEKARLEAEAKARAEIEAAARREAETKAAAEQAERDRLAAIEQQKAAEARAEAERIAAEERAKAAAEAARLAEIERQRQAQEQEEAARRRREADREHKAKIMGEAKSALMGLEISEELARTVVLAIAHGKIPHVTINF